MKNIGKYHDIRELHSLYDINSVPAEDQQIARLCLSARVQQELEAPAASKPEPVGYHGLTIDDL